MFDKNISKDKKKSLEFAEDQREAEWKYPSFALQLFHGQPDFRLIHPFPAQSQEDKEKGDVYVQKLEKFLKENLDPNEVDETGIIPDHVMKGLADLKAFAIKISEEYGGLGMSQVNYNRAIQLVASYCGSTAVLLSAHQSIGVPQPLKLFGTDEQKKKYLPMFSEGKVSAFALTEIEAGSDPSNMTTTATLTEDGQHYLINGEKIWCTNGLIADVIVVMAVTPPKVIKGKERKQITAFIVETDTPGIKCTHRCHFMGLHGIQNGVMRFTNVKVPKENIILGEGEGLKLALTTLNTGRLTLPAASTGVSKWCVYVSREWSAQRKQWGAPIGEHESIAVKLGYISSHAFAIDAMTWLTSAMADDQKKDIRIEAAIAKYFCTHHSYIIVDETLQIRGGQGYESSRSLKERGMKGWAVERVLRDVRINLIIEGTSEIMFLFIAREALDPHLEKTKPLLSSRTSLMTKVKAVFKVLRYYIPWYIGLWLPGKTSLGDIHPTLGGHMRYVRSTSKKLARHIIHQMMRHQKKLESQQSVLNRIVMIGTDLFAIASTCSYADHLIKENQSRGNALDLADLFCQAARKRISTLFKDAHSNYDRQSIQVAKKMLAREYEWLESEIIK